MGKIVTLNDAEKQRKQIIKNIAELHSNIKCNQKNIARLQALARGKVTFQTPSAAEYQRTRQDELRLPITIKNLIFQITLMEKEIHILKQLQE